MYKAEVYELARLERGRPWDRELIGEVRRRLLYFRRLDELALPQHEKEAYDFAEQSSNPSNLERHLQGSGLSKPHKLAVIQFWGDRMGASINTIADMVSAIVHGPRIVKPGVVLYQPLPGERPLVFNPSVKAPSLVLASAL